jgi:hypothetical protein
MNREELLLLQHKSVADIENKRMRETFRINRYAHGDNWDWHIARQASGSNGGRKNAQRPWVKKESSDER